MMDGFNYFVYRHIRVDKNVPFYVGIGSKRGKRLTHSSEFYRAYNTTSRSFLWKRIANLTNIEVDIIFESNDYDEALKKEVEFIAIYKSINDGGTLVNLTNGGEVFSENCRKANKKRGTKIYGGVHPSSILSDADAYSIINLFNNGERPIQISKKYPQVKRYAIYAILQKKNWKHLSHLIKDDAYASLYNKDNFHYNKKVLNTVTGEIIPSVSELSRRLKKSESTVRYWLSGNMKAPINYKLLN